MIESRRSNQRWVREGEIEVVEGGVQLATHAIETFVAQTGRSCEGRDSFRPDQICRAGDRIHRVQVVVAVSGVQDSTHPSQAANIKAKACRANDSGCPGGRLDGFQIPRRRKAKE